jgi:pSer/pThr/pTyr-binding forkhead associated (FHA) protein
VEVALVRVTAEGETQRVVLGKDRTVIGRQEGCQLRIPIAGVSRTHCEILIQGGSITVKDLGSSNGTYVNQERVTQQPLAPGDLISLGGQVFLVQVNGEPEEIDAEFLFEDGLPEEESKTSIAPPKAPVPAASTAKKADLDDASVMDFDFEDEDEAQPPL